jgi:hypothetical protein
MVSLLVQQRGLSITQLRTAGPPTTMTIESAVLIARTRQSYHFHPWQQQEEKVEKSARLQISLLSYRALPSVLAQQPLHRAMTYEKKKKYQGSIVTKRIFEKGCQI